MILGYGKLAKVTVLFCLFRDLINLLDVSFERIILIKYFLVRSLLPVRYECVLRRF